jgi:hypothetical protein
LRAFGLASTELASATVGTIRTELLKVAPQKEHLKVAQPQKPEFFTAH